ncbi:MAG TPA: PP2C family protein-serine/threonine phosphatase [Kineosporiaceae bacterium]|nr:PP2C family protein-serine/threonine phosphatase [Kineosporiaceae bacterium]
MTDPGTAPLLGQAEADVLLRMLDESHDLPPWLVPLWVERHAAAVGAQATTLYLHDYEQRVLVPLSGEAVGSEVLGTMSVDGTVAGRAFAHGEQLESVKDDGVTLWTPMLDGGDRVGVLSVRFPEVTPERRLLARRLAGLTTELVLSKGAHTDVYFRARRTRAMTLAAEMQWHLLPPLTLISPRVKVSGILEPAYEVGGDAFDYAVNHETAHFAIFDAMGHGLNASVMAAVVVGAYRHARRSGVPVGDMYTLIDAAFVSQFDDDRFVTAQLADLYLPTGEMHLVNAGHPTPLLIRGHKVVRTLGAPTTLPIGLDGPIPTVMTEFLEPGDRVLFYTDGVVEARRGDEPLGEDRLVGIVETELQAEVPSSEMMRRLNHRLLGWRRDGDTHQDDSTLLLVEWQARDLPEF